MYEDSCGCRRFNISDSVAAIGAESLCSSYSTSRGPGQKVISFSLYGNAVINSINNYFLYIQEKVFEYISFLP